MEEENNKNDNVITARLKRNGKLVYFSSANIENFKIGDSIIATTDKGDELGRIVKISNKSNLPKNIDIEKEFRVATKKDLDIIRLNEEKANEALAFCKEQVKKLKLDMKLLSAEYTFDMSKLTFYFVAEERIDFRELVRILASEYRARIELRQIGPRDEIKVYPNLGMCGREVCCRSFLQDFEPVTIKMAKDQGLQINMSKLSGACGKLMCCLKYEEEAYKENLSRLPKVGEIVKVDGESEKGKVVNIDILKLRVKVKFSGDGEEERFEIYPVEKITWKKSKNDIRE
ncbi:pSP1 domain protein [Clostridium sp. CAG:921]|nr:pSP1 domain protein [Clostridium sp. CAG:921]